MATHAYNIGYIYEDGAAKELFVYPSQEVKLQGEGSGSYRVFGKLTKNGAAKPLTLINAGTFETTDTATDDNIYICDVSGLYSISADNVSGMEQIHAVAFAGT